jgi:hypothetical protein
LPRDILGTSTDRHATFELGLAQFVEALWVHDLQGRVVGADTAHGKLLAADCAHRRIFPDVLTLAFTSAIAPSPTFW